MSGARSTLAAVTAVALCCGVAALLVAAGVLGATGGLLSSPELTVAALALAGWAVVRLVRRVRHRSTDRTGS